MIPTFPPTTQPNPRVQPQAKAQGKAQGLNPGPQPAQNARESDRRTNPHTWPNGAPRDASYLLFTADIDETAAAQRFIAKHGHPPDYIFETPDACGVLRVGPIRCFLNSL
jgi:hypothetical protein